MGREICRVGIRLVDLLKYVQNYTSRVGRAPLLVEVCRKCNEFRPVYMKSVVFALIPFGLLKMCLEYIHAAFNDGPCPRAGAGGNLGSPDALIP